MAEPEEARAQVVATIHKALNGFVQRSCDGAAQMRSRYKHEIQSAARFIALQAPAAYGQRAMFYGRTQREATKERGAEGAVR